MHNHRKRQIFSNHFDFASNDYLSISQHPHILDALSSAAMRGMGSNASPWVNGYQQAHQDAENAFCDWLGCERAMFFSSGYQANVSIIPALMRASDCIYADRYVHASIIDGIRLSRAKFQRYPHQSMIHLQRMCKDNTPQMIISEHVFSMDGDIAPLATLKATAKANDAWLLIDDAHGIGIIGRDQKGAHTLHSHTKTLQIMPMGKAFAGMGAMVCGRDDSIEHLIQHARGYGYSTAISPMITTGILAALRIIQKETWRLDALHHNIALFKKEAQQKGLALISSDMTPIQGILIPNHERLMRIWHQLQQQGWLVGAIRPPSVPKDSARLRICLHANHQPAHILTLINQLATMYR